MPAPRLWRVLGRERTYLVSGHDSSSDLLWGNLTHVQDDDGTDETDTETCNKATSHQKTKRSGSSLENNTNDEDGASSDDSCTTTNPISQVTSNQRTKECASRENRGDERLFPGREGEGIFFSLSCTGTRYRDASIEVDKALGEHGVSIDFPGRGDERTTMTREMGRLSKEGRKPQIASSRQPREVNWGREGLEDTHYFMPITPEM